MFFSVAKTGMGLKSCLIPAVVSIPFSSSFFFSFLKMEVLEPGRSSHVILTHSGGLVTDSSLVTFTTYCSGSRLSWLRAHSHTHTHTHPLFIAHVVISAWHFFVPHHP